jgi:hypothetical protein
MDKVYQDTPEIITLRWKLAGELADLEERGASEEDLMRVFSEAVMMIEAAR